MMQSEFHALTGFQPTTEQWEIIHKVYQWHPAIPDVGGKAKLAELWRLGGLGLISGMEGDAQQAFLLQKGIEEAERAVVLAAEGIEEAKQALIRAQEAHRQAQFGVLTARQEVANFAKDFDPNHA